MTRFKGVLPAVTTPFDDRLEVDHAALADSVEWLIDNGVHGLVATGTMGEAGSLTDGERESVTSTIIAAASGRVPVVVGISADDPERVARLARAAERAGAQGLMSTAPPSYEADEGELVKFFTRAASATDLPLMLYNSPAGTRLDLTPSMLASLAQIESVVAVKETSGDARRIFELLELTAGEIEVLVGMDDYALEGLAAGATGWVAGAAVVAPGLSVALFDACSASDLKTARRVYHALLPLARLDTHPKLVQYFKAALDAIGRYGGPSRPPRQPLLEHEQRRVHEAIRSLALQAAADGRPEQTYADAPAPGR
jgi:dihydrodipicolinate synthase/N-acetylneuraminate lyase